MASTVDYEQKVKRILIYAGGFQPIGGVETFIYNFINGFKNYAATLDLLIWGKDSDLLRKVRQANNRLTIYHSFWRWGCRFCWPDMVILPLGINLIKKADLVLFMKLFSPSIHFYLSRFQHHNLPRFVYFIEYHPREMWPPTMPKEKRQEITKLLNLYSLIIVPSPDFGYYLRRLEYLGEIAHIPLLPPKESTIVPYPETPGVFRVGFLGRLTKAKNLPYLLEAASLLKNAYYDANLKRVEVHIFGWGEELHYLESLARNLSLQEIITFHGLIPYDHINAAIDSCHLFAFPSHTEGQCLASLEILARGRPIVATPVGAFPEIINEQIGKIVPLNQPHEFAMAIKNIFSCISDKSITPYKIRSYYDGLYSNQKIIERYWDLFTQLT